MSQFKNYIILSTDVDGQIATHTSMVKALRDAEKRANELNKTVYVAKTTQTEGDVDVARFNPVER